MNIFINFRPYKCRKCGIAFKKSYHLKAHDTEVHIGIRPHVCETCGFSFARWDFTSFSYEVISNLTCLNLNMSGKKKFQAVEFVEASTEQSMPIY